MIFPDNKHLNKQAGVTLILGILVLSAVLAISFSLTTIIFIEIKSSSDLLKTEGALYGATGVGEQAFFNYIREVPSPGTYVSSFTNNVQLSGSPVVSTTTNPSFIDTIQPNSFFNNTKKRYSFCPPSALTAGCDFGKVVVKYISGEAPQLFAYLCQWDPVGSHPTPPCTIEGVGRNYWLVPTDDEPSCGENGALLLNSNGSVTLNSTTNCVSWTLDPDLQQELIITNLDNIGSITYFVSTFDSTGTVGKGLPSVGKTGVIIRTQNADVGRKIKVEVPSE